MESITVFDSLIKLTKRLVVVRLRLSTRLFAILDLITH